MRRPILALLVFCFACFNVSSVQAASAYPYPHPFNYSYGVKPAASFGVNWAADYTTLQTKWTAWKAANVTNSGAGGFLRVQRPQNSNDTVSEGISYGMILSVYFDDQATFNSLWQYKQLHNDGLGLMNWQINSGGGTQGGNSATDADEDIAYALYLASYQWGNGGTYNYKSLADAEVAKVKADDLDGSLRVKPGDSFDSCRYPSYFFPHEYQVFAKQTNDSYTWSQVSTNAMNTLALARDGGTGLVAEECSDTGQGGGCGVSSTQYQYNSCRVPFRMAQDYVYYGDASAQAEMVKLAGFFNSIQPYNVTDCYNLTGGGCGSSNNAAFEGPAACAFMVSGTYSASLQSYYNQLMGYSDTTYYNGALQLLTLLLLQGQMPNIADPAAIYTETVTPTQTPYAGSPTFTATPTPVAFGYVFEDFETGAIKNGYTYTGTGSTITQTISNTVANSGTDSNHLVLTVAASQYAGVGFISNYANAQGVINATGSNAVRIAIKTDSTVTFTLQFREAGNTTTPVAGGDGELWDSPPETFAASPSWQVRTISLTTPAWTEDAYSSNGAAGNNTMDLSAMQTCQLNFSTAVTGANVYVDDIAFIPSVAPTPTATKTPFNNPYGQLYDDFEAPMSLSQPARAATYADTVNGASATWSLDSGVVADGLRSAKLTYNTGSALAYGCGGYDISPYGTPALYVDASGAVQLAFWINAPAGLKYSMEFQEAGTPTSHTAGTADGEAWLSPIQTASAGWQYVVLDIGSFTEDPYNPICNPSGLAAPGPCLSGPLAGDNAMDLQAISSVTIKLNGNQGSGFLNLDDITFITTWKTPTPTISPSPSFSPTRSPSNTASPTPTASPSPSPSSTQTATPSLSPSGTPTASPTYAGTFTDSPTPTPFAGSPTNTFTPPDTATPTITLTWTPSATPSFSGTNTASPSPAGTATPSETPGGPSPSPTATVSPSPSNSPSSSVTPNPSFTPSLTATPNPSVTTSLTSTPGTGSATPTPTVGGPAATATPSITPGGPISTASPTATAAGGGGSGLILQTHAQPNPWTPASIGPQQILVLLAKDADGLDLKVYSEAMVVVGSAHLDHPSRGWRSLIVPEGLAAGIYYFKVTGSYHGTTVPAPKTGKLAILK